MQTIPDYLMSRVAWKFSKVVSGNRQDFYAAVVEYHQNINYQLNEKLFTEALPMSRILVEYEYETEEDSEWIEKIEQIDIAADSGQLSCLEILHKIHIQAHPKLKDLDHSYFEGLEYTQRDTENRIPVYSMSLGS